MKLYLYILAKLDVVSGTHVGIALGEKGLTRKAIGRLALYQKISCSIFFF